MGTYAEVDYNSLYLIVNSVASYPPQIQRERVGVGKITLSGWAHLHLSANFQNNQQKKGEYGEGEGKGRELTLYLWIDILRRSWL